MLGLVPLAAFAERLSYLKELGVTHIQLLPVMSYYFVNELKMERGWMSTRQATVTTTGVMIHRATFAFMGMYSTDPTDPMKRIEEFKTW